MQKPSPLRWLKRSMVVGILAATGFPAMAQDAVRVSWNPNTEMDLAGYRVYSGTTSKALSIATTVTGATTARLTGLAPGTKYFFAVQAFNSSGLASDLSPEVSFTTRVQLAPDIAVRTSAGMELNSGTAVFECPAASVGTSSPPQSLFIANTGNADLTQLSYTLSGAHPGDFEISTQGLAQISPGGSTGILVTFIPRESGARSANLTISSNDPDEGNFVISLTGIGEESTGVMLPEISVQQAGGSGLTNGSPLPYGAIDLLAASLPQRMEIRNLGFSSLEGLTVRVEGAHRNDFVLTGSVPAQLGAGESAGVELVFRPAAAGSRSATLIISSNDADESVFQLALSGTGVANPEIAISLSSGTDLTDDAFLLNYGSLTLGAPGLTQSLTIRNTGTGDLTGISAIIEGSAPGDFILGSPLPGVLVPGASTNLTITFLPKANGPRSAFLRVASSDSDENPFDLQLAGTGVAVPEIDIEKSDGSGLNDGSGALSFGVISLGSDTFTHTLTIRNSGTADLTGIKVTPSGAHASDFTVSGPATVTVAPGASTTFALIFRPGAAGTRTASIQVASNDADENPFDIALTGVGVANPEIAVEKQDGAPLTDGGAGLAFGPLNLSAGAVSHTLTIRNIGTANLTGISTSLDGSQVADFSIITAAPASLAPGASASLVIGFKPGAIGSRSAFLRINSNDTDESPFDIALSGSGFTEAEIAIEKADASPVADGGSHGFPSLQLGPATSVQSFTIRNTGNAALTGLALSVAGSHPQDFTTSALATNTLQAGASTTFSITFKPSAGGARSAVIRLASNDADENPYDLNVSGTGITVPEIAVEKSDATPLVDGSASLSMGSVILGPATSSQTMTIRNSGSGNLTGLAASLSGTHVADFSLSALATNTLAPGATTTLTITFKPGAAGSRAANLQIASNDADENPYDIALAGTGVALPEIAIEKSDATNLTDGITAVGFGTLNLSSAGATQSFTIRNSGTATLSGIALTIDGTHAADFAVVTSPAASLAPGGATTFSLRFRPLATGARAAFVRVASNDADENPFDIPLNGSGFTEPEIALEKSVTTPIADGGSHAFPSLTLGPATSSQSFTVRNLGNATLTGLEISFAGSHPQDFTASSLSANSLAPGASLVFNATFKPTAGGSRSAVLRLASNDADENPYDITLTGTGITVPEISVENQDGTLIADGAGNISFPNVNLGSTSSTRFFRVRNSGSGNLNISSQRFDGLHAADFSLSPAAPATIAPGAVAQIGITFRPTLAGTRSAWLRITNDDADESVYDISLSGIGVAVPEIAVALQGAADLQNGTASIAFPNVELLTPPSRKTLSIRNDGSAELNGLRMWIDGSHASDFSVTSPAVAALSPGTSTSLELSFLPTVAGPRSAKLHIASNDADEPEFVIDLIGNGVALPQIEISLASGPSALARVSHSHSFGSFELRTLSPEVTYVVRNRGSADLANLSLQLTGSHLADFTLRKFAITRLAPGASATFSAAFQPKTVGNRSAFIRIASNDPDNSIIDIPLTGTAYAKPEITVLAENISMPTGGGVFDFGNIDVGSPLAARSITIVNSGTAPLERLGLASGAINSAAFLTGSLERTNLAPGASMTFAVMFRPSSAGTFKAELRITSNDADEPVFAIQLNGTGVTKPVLAVGRSSGPSWGPKAETLAFGSVLPGSKGSSQTLVVRNSGNAPLNISSARVSGSHAGDFTPTGLGSITLPPGASRNLIIQFSPKSAGPRSASLEIKSNDPAQPGYVIPLTGTGLATPKLEVAVGTRKIADSDFIEFAPSTTRLITIRNRGTAPLTNLTARITEGAGSGFSIIPLKVKSIAPGKSTSLKVSLKVPSGNSSFAYLRITSNDPSDRDFDIVLTASSGPSSRKKSARVEASAIAPLPASRPKPEVSTVVVDGLKYRCITIRRDLHPGIQASSVQVSADLVNWSSGKTHTTVMVDRPDLLRVRDNTPVTPTAKRFIRLKQP